MEKIVNGEIKAEKGTPEQRVLDMLKCIDSSVAMDEDDIKYIKDIRSALVNAKTTEEFLNVVADIYKLAGINVLFDIDIDTDKKTGVPYPKFTITSAGFGGFLSFRTKTNTDEYNSLYKEIMVDYLDTIGAEFTDKEIDEAIKLQTVTCGDNDIYTAVISYLAFARMFDLVTDEEILAEVDDMRKLHPELFDESGEYLGGSSLYESKDREDADAAFSGFDLCDELSKYGFTNLEKIIIPVSKIAKEEKNVICEENLPALKINALIRLNEHLNISLNEEEDTAWSKISTFPLMVCLTKSAEELKEGLAETEDGEDSSAKETFSETTGVEFDEGLLSAVNLSKLGQLLPEDIGFIYVNHYYDDAISEVIGKMVQDIGSAYKKRFENNEWMSEETKKNAIKKLQNMLAVVGYPDNYTFPEIQSIEEGGSLFSNTLSIKRHNLSVLIRANEDKEFIRTKMFSPPDEVNAFYVFDYNTINIPAGILNPPVYDKDASYATNLGAIGMIIAHEIGHGFDEFGATFDENGCLNNWWTEEDYSEFMKIQEYFIEYYNQFEVVDGVVQDAKITIGENMADFAALQILMDIVGDDKEAQKECFESYARMWAKLGTVNYLTDSYFMDDVHASNVVRVNAVVASFDQFYELYDVKEGDLMYVAPEKRLKLW